MKNETLLKLQVAAKEQDITVDEMVDIITQAPNAMNLEQYILISIMEECNEVAQRCAKALRFGIKEIQSGQDLNNAERISVEFNDTIAAIQVWNSVQEALGTPENKIEIIDSLVEAKKKKIVYWADYAVEKGTLFE